MEFNKRNECDCCRKCSCTRISQETCCYPNCWEFDKKDYYNREKFDCDNDWRRDENKFGCENDWDRDRWQDDFKFDCGCNRKDDFNKRRRDEDKRCDRYDDNKCCRRQNKYCCCLFRNFR